MHGLRNLASSKILDTTESHRKYLDLRILKGFCVAKKQYIIKYKKKKLKMLENKFDELFFQSTDITVFTPEKIVVQLI